MVSVKWDRVLCSGALVNDKVCDLKMVAEECFEWIQVCYVAFWDDITLECSGISGKEIGQDGFIGKWRVVVVKELPFTDQRLNELIYVCLVS
ncbi:hypothetical protein SO802_028494 [Lithocarpus litseifolius]|uniref:TOD1/MUCI70 glycosyltransferase-like domain-containing protein n=1 Tax=Lithocarpus litseifolius TaxID=425828 RepID=A0AAW2BTM4_9ROSI